MTTTPSPEAPQGAVQTNPIAALFPGYFALVMATGVLSIAAKQQKILWLANSLFVVTAVAFALLVVLLVARLAMFTGRLINDLTSHAKGFAFLTIVAGANVLGALRLGHRPDDLLAFFCVAAFALGIVLYLIVMTMVFLRWTFQPLEPTEADPPAWIAAGAVAITVLAGSNLLATRAASNRVERLAPFIEGFVTLAWATATFWFPVMTAIGIWRHIVRRVPLRYHPSYWALVFPLGMYGAATFKMRAVVKLGQLDWAPKLTLAVALAAWTAAFVGMLAQGIKAVRRVGS